MAEQLFLERGFRQVSLALVANVAGVATRTIYTRFGNKQGLLDKLIEHNAGPCEALAAVRDNTEGDAFRALNQLAAYAFAHELSARTDLLHADSLAVRMGPSGSGLRRLHTGHWHDTLLAIFGNGEWRLGALLMTDPAILADLFIGCVLREYASASDCRHAPPCTATIDRMAQSVVHRFLDVVGVRR